MDQLTQAFPSLTAVTQNLHDTITVRGRSALRQLFRLLPPESEVRIQLVAVQNIGSPSHHPSLTREELFHAMINAWQLPPSSPHQLFDAAAIILSREERGIRVQAAISAYENGGYQRPASAIEADEPDALVLSQPLTPVTTQRVPLFDGLNVDYLLRLSNDQDSSMAARVAIQLSTIFSEGLPLPHATNLERALFDVIIRLPNGSYQQLSHDISNLPAFASRDPRDQGPRYFCATGSYPTERSFIPINHPNSRLGRTTWDNIGLTISRGTRLAAVPATARETRQLVIDSRGGAAASALQGPQDKRVEEVD